MLYYPKRDGVSVQWREHSTGAFVSGRASQQSRALAACRKAHRRQAAPCTFDKRHTGVGHGGEQDGMVPSMLPLLPQIPLIPFM